MKFHWKQEHKFATQHSPYMTLRHWN